MLNRYVGSLFVTSLGLLPWLTMSDTEQRTMELASIFFAAALSTAGYWACVYLIPRCKVLCLRRNLFGRDINKNGSEPIPESLGIVPGTVWLVVTVMFQPVFADRCLAEYNAALTSACFMLLLGFVDDVLDLRWSVKICSSFLATLPLLVAYTGSTYIVVPSPLDALLGVDIVRLGVLYHVYMALMGVFCTNAINIFAGVNGLEAGQSLVIGCAVLAHNSVELALGSGGDPHLLSFFLVLPFVATTLGLLVFNWYPSQVFVGDTFTYFAGMTLAMAGVLGHFSKTLMMFFAPQILNFAISLPQLFNTRWLPCPRHRLPRFNAESGKLEAIKTNWTLINLFLYIFGPMREDHVTASLLVFQALCCVAAFGVRYYLSSFFYNE
jgi:UDP-N-acetylglucosamine--dolichyl-phosphate N-acetylglucosaminephosphotransferase